MMNALTVTNDRKVTSLYDPRLVQIVRMTAAKDANDIEFEMFVNTARHLNLDPLRNQIYCFIFNKDNAEKRKPTTIIGITGYRSVAARTGNYRPDDEEPKIIKRKTAVNPDTNPLGIVSATVKIYVYLHGEWHKVVGKAKWDEYVPLADTWLDDGRGNRRQEGKARLDPKSNWAKMPELMIAKCAEALAIKKAFPDVFANTYEEAEIDRVKMIDLSASEYADLGAKMRREQALGGPSVTVDWLDETPLEAVPVGKFADRVLSFIKANPGLAIFWRDRNRVALNEFWKHYPSDCLVIKKEIEKLEKGTKSGSSDRITSGLDQLQA